MRVRGHADALLDEADDLDDLAELLEGGYGVKENETAEESGGTTTDAEAK